MTGVPMLLFLIPCASATPPAERPADVVAVRNLLLARHPVDLPGRAALDKHGGAASLGWLANNDELLSIRERALISLGTFPAAADRTVCRELVASAAHAKLRAAAIRCHHRDDLDDPLTVERLRDALRDPDPRVALASVAVLGAHPVHRALLAAAATDAACLPVVQAAVQDR